MQMANQQMSDLSNKSDPEKTGFFESMLVGFLKTMENFRKRNSAGMHLLL